jgi:hypothetical protein
VGLVSGGVGTVNMGANSWAMQLAPDSKAGQEGRRELQQQGESLKRIARVVVQDPAGVAMQAVDAGARQLEGYLKGYLKADPRVLAEGNAVAVEFAAGLVVGGGSAGGTLGGSRKLLGAADGVGAQLMRGADEAFEGTWKTHNVGEGLSVGAPSRGLTSRTAGLTDEGLPVFPEEKLARIEASLGKEGVTFVRGNDAANTLGDSLRGLYEPGAGAPGTVTLPSPASRVGTLEELIHVGQHRTAGMAAIRQSRRDSDGDPGPEAADQARETVWLHGSGDGGSPLEHRLLEGSGRCLSSRAWSGKMKALGRYRVLRAEGFSLVLEVIEGGGHLDSGQVFEKQGTEERYRCVSMGCITPPEERRSLIVVAPFKNSGAVHAGDVLRATEEVWRPPLPD